MKLALFCALILPALSGCGLQHESAETPLVQVFDVENSYSRFLARLTYQHRDLEGKSYEQQRSIVFAASRAAMPLYQEAFTRLEAAPSSEEKNRIAEEMIAATPVEGRFIMEQFVGQYMLEHLLATENPDLDLVSHHVEALHRNESQRADLLAGGLSQLRQVWPAEKVQLYAAEGAARAERWLGAMGRATTSSARLSPESPAPQTTNVELVASGLDALEKLAN